MRHIPKLCVSISNRELKVEPEVVDVLCAVEPRISNRELKVVVPRQEVLPPPVKPARHGHLK